VIAVVAIILAALLLLVCVSFLVSMITLSKVMRTEQKVDQVRRGMHELRTSPLPESPSPDVTGFSPSAPARLN
jgi:hypothetical protein